MGFLLSVVCFLLWVFGYLLWNLGGTLFKQISTLIVTVLLARILSPEEFGLIGMALVFVSISQVFVDVGFSQGLIQSKENTQKTYSSVFFITIGLGALVTLIIFLLASPIGAFYESEQVASIVRWLCFIPLISSFGGVHNAIFVRNLDFKVLAYRTVLSTLIGGLLGVILALLDFGVYALVVQQLVSTTLFTFILWWKSDWKPTFEFSYQEIKKLLNFSGYVFLDNLLRRTFMKIDTLFIGKYFSAATLGFYSRAESLNAQIMQYTTSSLRAVLFPAFSKLQDDKELFDKSYFKVFNISTFIGGIATGVLFFLAEDIILLLLGEKWRPSILIFQLLVFRLLVSPFGALIGKAILAKGHSRATFILGQIRRVILLIPIYVGYKEGIYAFTLALVVVELVAFLVSLVASYKYLNISFFLQLKKFLFPLLPLIIFIIAYYSISFTIYSVVWAVCFISLQVYFSYLIKNEGFTYSVDLLLSLKKKYLKK